MELDDYIKKCKNPVALAKFIESPGSGIFARFWDNFTLDIMVEQKIDLSTYAREFTCPICGTQCPPRADIDDTLCGGFATCPECKQVYFIHKALPFGGTELN